MTFIAYDGEAKKLYAVQADSEDKARDILAAIKTGSDGDEFSIQQVPEIYGHKAIELTGLL